MGIILLFMLGVFLYVFAALSTFGLEPYISDLGPFAIIMLTLNGSLGALVLGYASVIILGGKISLKLTEFTKLFPVIKRGATDERNFVKKAVNWALRNIGKRNVNLNRAAIEAAKEIQRIDSKAARWIASDAIRELESKAVQRRLRD